MDHTRLTIEQARDHIGHGVVYHAAHPGAPAEQGTVTSVNDTYVFVRYGSNAHSKATRPGDLELLAS